MLFIGIPAWNRDTNHHCSSCVGCFIYRTPYYARSCYVGFRPGSIGWTAWFLLLFWKFWCAIFRSVEQAMGDGIKRIYPEEMAAIEKTSPTGGIRMKKNILFICGSLKSDHADACHCAGISGIFMLLYAILYWWLPGRFVKIAVRLVPFSAEHTADRPKRILQRILCQLMKKVWSTAIDLVIYMSGHNCSCKYQAQKNSFWCRKAWPTGKAFGFIPWKNSGCPWFAGTAFNRLIGCVSPLFCCIRRLPHSFYHGRVFLPEKLRVTGIPIFWQCRRISC